MCGMNFELIDRYLLDGTPGKADVVRTLLSAPVESSAASPFYEGMRMLGARTPDLTLIALRLVLAGKRADDESVVRLRELVAAAREDGSGAREARLAYHEVLAEPRE